MIPRPTDLRSRPGRALSLAAGAAALGPLLWMAQLAPLVPAGAARAQAGAQEEAREEAGDATREERRSESGWADHLDPRIREGRRFLRRGLSKVLAAIAPDPDTPEIDGPASWLTLEQALVRLREAERRLGPTPELLFLRAVATSRWEREGEGGRRERRLEEAVEAWLALRRAAPEFHPDIVAAELANLRSMRVEHELAIPEYERALAGRLPPPAPLDFPLSGVERAQAILFLSPADFTLHLNMAESIMLTGDPARAVTHYRRAAELGEVSPITRALAFWGEALALDRVGQHRGAIEAARRAIENDPQDHFDDLRIRYGPMAVLHSDGVFFEPRYELHAYEALGHEALADMRRELGEEAEEVRAEERRALMSWRVFLSEGGRRSRYASFANGHIERLAGLVGEAPERGARPAAPARAGARR